MPTMPESHDNHVGVDRLLHAWLVGGGVPPSAEAARCLDSADLADAVLRAAIVGMAVSKVFKTADVGGLRRPTRGLHGLGCPLDTSPKPSVWVCPASSLSAMQRRGLLCREALVSLCLLWYRPTRLLVAMGRRRFGVFVAYGTALAFLLSASWCIYPRERPSTAGERSRRLRRGAGKPVVVHQDAGAGGGLRAWPPTS